jgi:signal transduction histidine kinase/CheY-like chemotaxis protein
MSLLRTSTRTKWATLALVGGLVLIVGVFGAILELDRHAHRQKQAELLVAHVEADIIAAQNTPWDADLGSERKPRASVLRHMRSAETHIREILDRLDELTPGARMQRILALQRRNSAILERQLTEVAVGRRARAQVLSDRALVVASQLQQELSLEAKTFGVASTRAYRQAILGTGGLLSGVFVAFALAVALLLRAQKQNAAKGERLQHAQKMEAVGGLAGGVAHDFNNVLTALLGYAELASKRAGHDDTLRSYLDEVVRAGESGQALTAQLLAFSRHDDSPAARPLDVSTVVAETEPLLRRLVSAEIQIELELDRSAPAVAVNRTRLEQILLNLVSNAADAMRGTPGRLTIATRVERGRVVLEATDTGVGMDQATRVRIFEPYYTTKPIGKGTGIGLANVFAAVREAGGEIAVTSKQGVGTTFRLSFPAAGPPDEVAAPVPTVRPPPAAGSGTILVVDDEDPVRRLLDAALRQMGYATIVAADGAEALRVGTERLDEIDLLLTDFRMPGMNGHDLAVALTRLRPGLKVILMSGYRDNATIPPGALPLQKPFSLADLERLVQSLLGGGEEQVA